LAHWPGQAWYRLSLRYFRWRNSQSDQQHWYRELPCSRSQHSERGYLSGRKPFKPPIQQQNNSHHWKPYSACEYCCREKTDRKRTQGFECNGVSGEIYVSKFLNYFFRESLAINKKQQWPA
jgi:hypothetical protein